MFKKSTEILPINVLIVDDKKENLFSLEKLLEDETDEVNFIQSTSGFDALKVVLNNEIALVLLDVQMPELNGYEVAKLLKENNKTKNIPIIFVTAQTQETGYVLEGYQKGAVDYLFKPLNPALARAKVKAFIQIYQQQKELEQKNRELENLGLLVHNSVDIMSIFEGVELRLITANPAWEDTLGYRLDEILGMPFFNYIYNDDGTLKRLLSQAIQNKSKLLNYENQLLCKDHSTKWFSWCFVYSRGNWYASARDITERKMTEAKLNKAYEEMELRVQERTIDLKRSNESLTREIEKRKAFEKNLKLTNDKLKRTNADLDSFVYTASHDLKLPIANIEGLIQTLSEELKPVNEGTQNILDMVNYSITQLRDTIQDLLKIIKIQKENQEEVVEVNCKELLEDIKLSIKDIIASTNATIHANFEECESIKLTRACLKSIIYNLVSNSIKYRSADRSPEIFIRLVKEGQYHVLSVKDNGLGIKEESIGKIFTMFKRLHDHVEGTGIGLYIVKNTVEKYGGRIEVQSQEGVGTEFKIYFRF